MYKVGIENREIKRKIYHKIEKQAVNPGGTFVFSNSIRIMIILKEMQRGVIR